MNTPLLPQQQSLLHFRSCTEVQTQASMLALSALLATPNASPELGAASSKEHRQVPQLPLPLALSQVTGKVFFDFSVWL